MPTMDFELKLSKLWFGFVLIFFKNTFFLIVGNHCCSRVENGKQNEQDANIQAPKLHPESNLGNKKKI